MEGCPEQCETSCYRCLRSFKNKFEHTLLDRHVGVALLRYLLTGEHPEFDHVRLKSSSALLYHDLLRQSYGDVVVYFGQLLSPSKAKRYTLPFLLSSTTGRKAIVALSGPLTPDRPSEPTLADLHLHGRPLPLIVENELLVRSNLPAATRSVLRRLGL